MVRLHGAEGNSGVWDVCGDTTGLFSCTPRTCRRQRYKCGVPEQTGVSEVLTVNAAWC